MRLVVFAFFIPSLVISLICPHSSLAQPLPDYIRIEQITGVKGSLINEERVFKISKPRNDVPVSVDGRLLSPFMGLGSWAAFTPSAAEGTMVMGDMVLFEDEVNAVMSVALESGFAVTALHNHFFYDEPRVYFMHITGSGEEATLARGIKKIWDKSSEIRAANRIPAKSFEPTPAVVSPNKLTIALLESYLGMKGQSQDGMFKIVLGRIAHMHGTPLNKEMGVNTWAAFAGSDDEAIIDGDFAVNEDELQSVLKSMRHDNFNIVAIHQHMTKEKPRILFLHYWGKGNVIHLASGFRNALTEQAGTSTDPTK